ncbi:protein LNK2 isoform X2 [Lotus japonicus]|uniref:protein LNK2 isoform X2 n=1 Tax=Lotus japonicus TaxID=34305 RepID=UPI0025836945|nr:protein LNK2 isoform X2 [Lotus japonicus]
MFDWNDEELTNIIWDEGDDHIVPFPEESEDLSNKKELNEEAAVTKLTELKKAEAKTDFHGIKLGSSCNHDNSGGLPTSGVGKNTWPDLSLSSAVKIDHGSLGTEVYKNLGELSKFSSSRGGNTQHEKEADIFQNADEGKEQGDFVDYGWANIGSFDDLDRVFSNDDPIFGYASLDNSDELWSSKDVNKNLVPIPLDAPSPAGALRNRSKPLEIKEEDAQCNDQPFSLSYEKTGDPASQVTESSHTIAANMGCSGDRTNPSGKGLQAFRQKNQFKSRKKSLVKQEGKALQDFYGNWSSSATPARQFENQLASSALQSSQSSIPGQPKQLQIPETLYQNIINPYATSSVYRDVNTYPDMPMLSHIHSGDVGCQPVHSGYEVSPCMVNPLMNSVDSVKPQTMTPQEKIEKLRRRQQIQAMLAIQKQQQELSHQVPSTSKSISKKCPAEIQSHLCDGTDPEFDDLRTLSALDLPIEQDDSNTISLAIDNDFVEETVLNRLQDIISKLDIRIRLCIRDSLFRLAQSAIQRHYASDTSSANKGSKELEVITGVERNSQSRHARKPDVETETNPIDRTVAHLLFHRPIDFTGNYSDKLESPSSTKVQCESKAANLVNFPETCLPEEDMKSNRQFPHLGLKNSWPSFEAQPMDETNNSPCRDTSVNASNAQELEASQ